MVKALEVLRCTPYDTYLSSQIDYNIYNIDYKFSYMYTLPEIWDKMAEIMQIIIHYGDKIRL